MLILIEGSERGLDIAKGIWGAFNSCLCIDEEEMDISNNTLQHLIGSCEQSNVTLVIATGNMEWYKERYSQAFYIECDGMGFGVSKNVLSFNKEYPRDRVVEVIITHFKRNKLL